MSERRIEEAILLVTHTMQHCQDHTPEEGGLFASLDQYKAFDSVQWTFLFETLDAFGYPKEFIDIIRTLYKDVTISIKINGKPGEKRRQTAGLRQGCPCSALLFLLIHEVLLRGIRENEWIEGIKIPGADGSPRGAELKERAFADDTGVMLASENSLTPLMETLDWFENISPVTSKTTPNV